VTRKKGGLTEGHTRKGKVKQLSKGSEPTDHLKREEGREREQGEIAKEKKVKKKKSKGKKANSELDQVSLLVSL